MIFVPAIINNLLKKEMTFEKPLTGKTPIT
jgi:hypothetical protein